MGLNPEPQRGGRSGLPANAEPAFLQIERTAALVFDDEPVDAVLDSGERR